MKKVFVLLLGVVIVFGAMAQEVNTRKAIPIKFDKNLEKVVKKGYSIKTSKDIESAEMIGTTNYDLQTNDAVARRLIVRDDGTMSGVWTEYHGQDVATGEIPQRGTGYAYFDGTEWDIDVTGTTVTIDNVAGNAKKGWPCIVDMGATEFVLTHGGSTGVLNNYGQTTGAAITNWTQQSVSDVPTSDEGLFWPRAIASGDVVHVMCAVLDAAKYKPGYARSTDGGENWEGITDAPFPTFDTEYGINNLSGDSYAIDATGDVVAIVIFHLLGDFTLYKSIDAGLSWETTVIADFPVDAYDWKAGIQIDVDTDGLADTCVTVNNADVIVDANGKVHVAFSTMTLIDEDAGDNAASYYYGYNNGVHYWNDDMAAGEHTGGVATTSFHPLYISEDVVEYVGFTPDLNGNDDYEITGAGVYGFQGWCGYPSITVGADNEVIISFSATMEGDNYLKSDAFPEPQNYRHVWLTLSSDGGTTFGDIFDVTDIDLPGAEAVMCCLAKSTYNNSAHIMYEWDSEPGSIFSEDAGEPVTLNYILYKEIKFIDLVGISDNLTADFEINVHPNPTNGIIKVTNVENSEISIFNMLGAKIMTVNSDSYSKEINMTDLPVGTYFVKVTNESGTSTKKVMKTQ